MDSHLGLTKIWREDEGGQWRTTGRTDNDGRRTDSPVPLKEVCLLFLYVTLSITKHKQVTTSPSRPLFFIFLSSPQSSSLLKSHHSSQQFDSFSMCHRISKTVVVAILALLSSSGIASVSGGVRARASSEDTIDGKAIIFDPAVDIVDVEVSFWSTCLYDSDCTATVRSRYPNQSYEGVELCKCYADSSITPFDDAKVKPMLPA